MPPPPTHIAKLEARKASYPAHPDVRFPYVRCTVRVWIDTEGLPYHSDAKGCPQVFAEASERSIERWRFEPVAVDGAPVTAQGMVGVTYRLAEDQGSPPPPPPACEWRLTVYETRDVSVAGTTAANACAAWFPERVTESVTLQGLSGQCVIVGGDEAPKGSPDPLMCPDRLQQLARDLVGRSMIARSSIYTIRIDLP